MGPAGAYKINNLDLYTNFKWAISEGSDDFLKWEKSKEVPSHAWPEENGTEYDLSERFYEDAPATIKGTIFASSEAEFWTQYLTLKALLQSAGELVLYIAEFDKNFLVFYKEMTDVKRLTRLKDADQIAVKVEILFQNISVIQDGEEIPAYESDSMLTRDIKSDVQVGGVNVNDILIKGLKFTDFAEKIFVVTINPDYIDAYFALTTTQGNIEVGATINVPLLFGFNRGSIVAKWPNGSNLNLLGAATNYRFYDAADNLLKNQVGNAFTVNGYVAQLGANTFKAEVDYGVGDQPKNNHGDNVGTPQPAATSPRQSVSFNALLKHFWGPVSSNPSTPAQGRLASSDYSTANTITMNTGTALATWAVAVAPNKHITKVMDTTTNTNITVEYGLVNNNFSVNNAGGVAVAGYKLYVKSQSGTYDNPHTHVFTLAND